MTMVKKEPTNAPPIPASSGFLESPLVNKYELNILSTLSSSTNVSYMFN